MASAENVFKGKVDLRKLVDLKPFENNTRTHDAAQVDELVALINEFGWTNPILADRENHVHAGHGRMLAAAKIYASKGRIKLPSGETLPDGTVPVLDCSGWSLTKRRAYIIADNKVAEHAGWDYGKLRLEFAALKLDGFNLDLTGFKGPEISFVGGVGDNDPQTQWQGMPEYTSDGKWFRRLVVHFENQEAVDAFAKLVAQEIGAKTKFIWYPEAERGSTTDRVYKPAKK